MAQALIGSLRVDFGANTAAFEKGVTDIERRLKGVERSLQKTARKFQSVGRTMTRNLTAPIAAIGALTLKVAGDFEASMNRVSAVSGATEADMVRLRDAAKEMGLTTQFSASQAADAMAFLAQAGFNAEQVLSALPGTLQLAASAQMELGQTADIVSNILSGYGFETEQLARVNDVLVKTFTSTNTNLEQLGEAMKMAAPIASAAGVSFEEASAAIGLMGNAGIQATLAGTSLRGAVSKMLNPSKEASKIMAGLGLSFTDASGRLLGLDEILTQLAPHADDAGLFLEIFGQRAGPAMAALVSQGSGALVELTAQLENSGGTAQRIADKQMEGFNGAMKRLRSAFEGLLIAIADSGILDAMADFANSLAAWLTRMSELNPQLLKFATIAAGLVAVIGPIVSVIGALIVPVGTLIAKIGLLLGAGGIPALAAAFAAWAGPIAVVTAGVLALKAAYDILNPLLFINNEAMIAGNAIVSQGLGVRGQLRSATKENAEVARDAAKAYLEEAEAALIALEALQEKQLVGAKSASILRGVNPAVNQSFIMLTRDAALTGAAITRTRDQIAGVRADMADMGPRLGMTFDEGPKVASFTGGGKARDKDAEKANKKRIDRALQLQKETRTPLEEYKAQLELISEIEKTSFDDAGGAETFSRARADALIELGSNTENLKDAYIGLAEAIASGSIADIDAAKVRKSLDGERSALLDDALRDELKADEERRKSIQDELEKRQSLVDEIIMETEARLQNALAAGNPANILILQNEIDLLREKRRLIGKGLSDEDAQRGAEDRQFELDTARLHGQARDAFKGGFRAAIDGDLGGFLENKLKNAASGMFDNALDMLFDALMGGMGGGGGGLLGGLIGGLFSFDGGGFTGNRPRSGGLDGKGGFLAMMHGNETVIDHTKMGSMSMPRMPSIMPNGGAQSVKLNISVSTDDVMFNARVKNISDEGDKATLQRVPSIVSDQNAAMQSGVAYAGP